MDKSPEAFRTISEVADFLDTPAHVLRFWESRFPQIRPVKRAGGRRYYRPGDVALLAGIKKLLHDEGMTIRGVQKILREQGIRHVANLGSDDPSAGLMDSDVEAVLSAEYGPIIRAEADERLSEEALQSAQIISLEAALNRQDSTRGMPAAQADLWPADPSDVAAMITTQDDPQDGSVEAWPGDPADPGPPEEEPATQTGPDLAPQPADMAQGQFGDLPIAADGSVPPVSTDPTPDDGVSPAEANVLSDDGYVTASPLSDTAAVESAAMTDEAGTESDETGPTAAVAALLRRTSPAQVAHVQPELALLRDRLIVLRGRVAEAARRRAK